MARQDPEIETLIQKIRSVETNSGPSYDRRHADLAALVERKRAEFKNKIEYLEARLSEMEYEHEHSEELLEALNKRLKEAQDARTKENLNPKLKKLARLKAQITELQAQIGVES